LKVRDGLLEWMRGQGVRGVADLVGAARPR